MAGEGPSAVDPEIDSGRFRLPRLWGRQGVWQIRLRWAVAPLMVGGLAAGRQIGFDLPWLPILLIAIAISLYNLIFFWIFERFRDRLESDPVLDRRVILAEALVDYLAMFALIHFTGGVSSPLVVFLLFHVIIAAVQFQPTTAYQLAAVASGGLWLMLIGETAGWLPYRELALRGQSIHLLQEPAYLSIWLLFFSATLFLAAALVSRVMRTYRRGVDQLAEATTELALVNHKLRSLYAMVGAISAERQLQPILDKVTSEMTKVMEVPAVTVKLLSEDGRTLRYVASQGLPQDLVTRTVIDLDKSPVNRRVIEGETLVQAVVRDDDTLQLGPVLSELGIRSAVFAPLAIEDRVIGTLGVYSHRPDRFNERHTEFLRLAAKLVAIAIEDARANEAVDALVEERTRFMLQVAHNLRAPLSAALSMLELLEDTHMGDISPQQRGYLERIEERLSGLDQMIGELLTIARTRDLSREIPDVLIDLEGLAAYTERTFRSEAERSGLSFEIEVEPDLPEVVSGADLLQQVMDNLVSNAIKYTPQGGRVEVRFGRTDEEHVQIEVEDTGIGIPVDEQPKLFREFFRASNARKQRATGTGLGLALVKQTVDRHRGELELTSAEGHGTLVRIVLPILQPRSVLA